MSTRRQQAGMMGGAPLPYVVQPASSTEIDINLKGPGALTIYWGDGLSNSYTLNLSTNTTVSHTYASGAERDVKFDGAITSWTGTGDTFYGGDVANLPRGITYLEVWGYNTLSGAVSGLPTGLTYLYVIGSNTLSGDVSGLPTGLTVLVVYGTNTLSGAVSGLPAGLTYLLVIGSNTVSGDVSGLPTGITYLVVWGSNTLSGELSGIPSVANYVSLGSASSTMALATAALPTGLCYFLINQPLPQASLDNILSAFWANRDAAKPRAERTIDIDYAGSGTPSAAGLVDKTNLQAYRSPSSDPTKPFWTVNTL